MIWCVCLDKEGFFRFFEIVDCMVELFLHTIVWEGKIRLKKKDNNMVYVRMTQGNVSKCSEDNLMSRDLGKDVRFFIGGV